MTSYRRSLLARLHIAKQRVGLDDDGYRDFLEANTGRRSAKCLSVDELRFVTEKLSPPRRGRIGADDGKRSSAYGKKLQALWLSGWNLGLIRDRSDAALISFICRQTGLSHPRFLIYAGDAARAIEALKFWLARDGGVRWEDHPKNPAACVCDAQMRRLASLDASFAEAALSLSDLAAIYGTRDWVELQRALGRKLRSRTRERSNAAG